ncbi:O-antigen ligase family protein [uncultured Bacteroides sp.]|uniref:O-antigen ligase family protein n=1 Tax=uncultured Bacteroides sp. TaxID=162156 RepID=UPI00280B2F6F|nr:O-antigen ligase family protein [uncultured Bacteroides sp.]
MEKSGIGLMGKKVADILCWVAVTVWLLPVCCVSARLPAGEVVGQWVWLDKVFLGTLPCILLALLAGRGRAFRTSFCSAVVCVVILLGGVQAVWGLRQLYGFTASGHSLYAMTGSFFNPGPYSGYLAMVLPVCLYQWLTGGKAKRRVAGGVMLLILCVLPAGMSRSAWLAAGVSCLWVYGCYAGWGIRFRLLWICHWQRVAMAVVGGLCLLALGGWLLFALKPDSARGRLFMWKMACSAIAEKPFTGHGIGSFAAAYGDEQEHYFAAGDYALWEERVAGSPEYAFNEYLQAAVELGIPLAFCLLAVIIACLCVGIRKGRYGICGAVLSLMVFSFSSYPLQLPAFVVTFAGLLLACILGNNRWEWLGLAILAGGIGGIRLKDDLRTEQACREWMNAKVLYNAGGYQSAVKDYGRLYPLLKKRAAFLFEYGHGLHKQQEFEASNRILKEALQLSCDPMILNVIGKNYQQMGDCLSAEDWFIRSTHRLPGRIYPYYLLAKLYVEPSFRQPDKFEKMKRMVLTKEPKVQSTAIRQMREEVKKMGNDK